MNLKYQFNTSTTDGKTPYISLSEPFEALYEIGNIPRTQLDEFIAQIQNTPQAQFGFEQIALRIKGEQAFLIQPLYIFHEPMARLMLSFLNGDGVFYGIQIENYINRDVYIDENVYRSINRLDKVKEYIEKIPPFEICKIGGIEGLEIPFLLEPFYEEADFRQEICRPILADEQPSDKDARDTQLLREALYEFLLMNEHDSLIESIRNFFDTRLKGENTPSAARLMHLFTILYLNQRALDIQQIIPFPTSELVRLLTDWRDYLAKQEAQQ